MFRRIMIVCWVLFSLGAVVGLAGWAGYDYYDGMQESKQEAYDEQRRKERESQELNGDRNGSMRGGRLGLPIDPVIERNKQRYEIVGLTGGCLAALIFLWNLLWHTGHWIWMGRKPNG